MSKEIATIRQDLTKMSPEIRKVLPDHISTERFERITLTALQRSPDLLQCSRKSLFESVMRCAEDGLIPDGREAALVKFKDSVAYMPMVAGILKKTRQSGEIATITAQVVYEQDTFEYWIDDQGEHLTHRPDMESDDPGKPRCVYAMARTKTGETYVEVLRMSDVDKIRKASRSSNGGPWSTWWSEMARKSAIRRLSKRLPMSTDLERVVTRDDDFYDFDRDRVVDNQESAPSAKESVEVLKAADVSAGYVLFDADGAEIKSYRDGGRFLNALEAAIDASEDRQAAQSVWAMNADSIDNLASESEKYADRVSDISAKISAMPNGPAETVEAVAEEGADGKDIF